MAAPFARAFARAFSAACAAVLIGGASAAGCAVGTPHIDHGPGAPARPAALWPVPPAARVPAPDSAPPTAPEASRALAEDARAAGAVQRLSLADVLDLALRNSPTTRASWATARAQAQLYGASRGALYPTINGSLNLTRIRGNTFGGLGTGTGTGTGAGTGAGAGTGTGTGTGTGAGAGAGTGTGTDTSATTPSSTGALMFLSPTITLSYLIVDFGGRAGAIEVARQQAIAADLAHNAAVRDVVLQAESALFSFLANRALYAAQQVAVEEAQADLAQASERHRVGLAAIDEVMQARTALGQQRLQLATLDADTAIAHGALAAAMGLPANARFSVPEVEVGDSVASIAASVDSLIERAIGERAELAEAQAQAREFAAQVRVARSAGYPTLTLTSTNSYTRNIEGVTSGRSYAIVLGLQIPIFAGFSRRYDIRAARDQYEAALANLASTRQQITVQVFTSYYSLQAAAQRVGISTELLADAQRSAEVAAGQYRGGVGTLIQLLLTRSALVTARAAAIQARWEWRIALVQLGHDVGVLDPHGRPNLRLDPTPTEVPR